VSKSNLPMTCPSQAFLAALPHVSPLAGTALAASAGLV